MANTITISSLTNEFVEMDLVTKYKSLVDTALDSEGIYIRTKETLEELFDNKNLTAKEKADIIGTVLGNLNNSVVSGAMQTALAWEAKEKEFTFNKIELEYKLGLLNEQILAQKQNTKTEFVKTAISNAELLKNYGVAVDGNGIVTDTSIDGKLDKEVLLLEQERTNKQAEKLILDAKLKESNAAIHKIIADTYENYGYYNYTIGDGGVASVTKLSSHETLAANQKLIAKEQAKGYAYNAWSNAAQSSASMIGALVAAEVDGISSYVSQWSAIVSQLGAITTPTTTGL